MAKFWKRLFSRTIDDINFGRLSRRDGQWIGKLNFSPLNKDVLIVVNSGRGGPSELQHKNYRELEAKFNSLKNSMHAALFNEYLMQLKAVNMPAAAVEDSKDHFSSHCTLFRIEIDADDAIHGPVDFILAFDIENLDHCICVSMKGWEVLWAFPD